MLTHTYLTTTTIDGWQLGFTYVSLSHDWLHWQTLGSDSSYYEKARMEPKSRLLWMNILPKTWFLELDFLYSSISFLKKKRDIMSTL
jgi:hypothetical protein